MAAQDPSSESRPLPLVRNRLFQFRLQTLFLLALLVSLALGTWEVAIDLPYKREGQTIRELRALGADVTTASRGSVWLRRVFGNGYFARVVGITRGSCSVDRELLSLAGKCVWLEWLDIGDSEGLGADDFAPIASLPRLKSIDMHRAEIDDDAIGQLQALPALEHLNLYDTRIGNDALRHLGRMRNLKSLLLDGTAVTDAGMDHISSLPRLEFLSLRGTQVTDAGVLQLQTLPKLQRLVLRVPPSFLKGIGPVPDAFGNKTYVSGGAVAKLRRARPKLSIRW